MSQVRWEGFSDAAEIPLGSLGGPVRDTIRVTVVLVTLLFLGLSNFEPVQAANPAGSDGTTTAVASGQADGDAMLWVASLPETLVSMTTRPGGGVVLLLDDGNLLLVNSGGKTERRTLPRLADGKDADFCDLAIREKQLILCRSQDVTLYSCDLQKAGELVRLPLVGFPTKAMILNVHAIDGRIYVSDDNGVMYEVAEPGGTLTVLATGTVPVRAADGTWLRVMPPAGDARPKRWQLLAGERSLLLRNASGGQDLFGLQPLGIDKASRTIVLETTGTSELDNTCTLLAIADGVVTSSRTIDDRGSLSVVRFELLLEDGSIALLRPEPDGEGAQLLKVTSP